jgi:hypothetical protein
MARQLIIGALTLAASCVGDRQAPMEPVTGGRPRSLISDGAHSGTPGFFFLAPLVSQPSTSGTLDADIAFINPVVAICDITDGPDVACGASTPGATPAVRTFTVTSDPAITIDGDKYRVNWDTGEEVFVAGHLYRVHVFAGPARLELGFADVLLSEKAGQVTNHDGETVALRDGRTLPVQFRIEQNVVPREGPAQSFQVSGLNSSIEAGTDGSMTVTVHDASGTVATLYTGTIAFTSNDPLATLPASYTFTAADAGTHTFSSVTLRTAGSITVTATDQADNTIIGAQTVSVTPAAVARLALSGAAQTTAGIAHSVTVTAQDEFGNTVSSYAGTVGFSSNDPAAMLPSEYAFQPGDGGVGSFPGGVTFFTAGSRTLEVTDAAGIAGSLTTTVVPAAPAELRFTTQPSNTVSFQRITPAAVVTVYDAFGNQATNFAGIVRVGLHESSAVLFGTFDVRAVSGVATYSSLIIVDVGTGYILAASLAGVPRVLSAPFDITPAP